MAWEGQSILPIFLQHSTDCVTVRFAGAMHASNGVATPSKITSITDNESHRRITELYPGAVPRGSDVDHIPRNLIAVR
jgi:hypothetical protein